MDKKRSKKMKTYKMNHEANFKMVENKDATVRYEFWSRAVKKSNIDNTIAYYTPVIRRCRFVDVGSTYYDRDCSVEEGNELYKKLIREGWKVVKERSFA